MKPTLAQLKKRPAWWIDEEGDISISYPDGAVEEGDVAISYPDGTVEFLCWGVWLRSSYDVKHIKTAMTFGGWIEKG